MFADALEAMLRDHATPADVRAIEAGGDFLPLWHRIVEAGFLQLLTPEERGGAAACPQDLFPVFELLGSYAVPLPVGQSIAAQAFLPDGAAPAGLITLAPALRIAPDGRLSCPAVPFGTIADFVLAEHDDSLWLLPCASALRLSVAQGRSQCATLRWDKQPAFARFARPGACFAAFAAALHAALLAGAMERVFQMTLAYGNDRVQFGRSIGKFQAIQHQLAVMAEQLASARMAAQSAWATAHAPTLLQGAIAKARSSEAVPVISAIAHSIHGAIGITEEYDLQLFTRRLHEWRMAHGSEDYWHQVVGREALRGSMPAAAFVRTAAQGER